MREDIKVRWVEELRSGDYPQTEGVLANESGFCCLGVLCEIAVEDGVISKTTKSTHEGDVNHDQVVTYATDTNYEMDAVLPLPVYGWAGLETSNPNVWYDGVHQPISDLNDDYHMNFSQIADVIEDQY